MRCAGREPGAWGHHGGVSAQDLSSLSRRKAAARRGLQKEETAQRSQETFLRHSLSWLERVLQGAPAGPPEEAP